MERPDTKAGALTDLQGNVLGSTETEDSRAAPDDQARDFCWHDAWDQTSIAVPEQHAIAVYTNGRGEIAIRQQDWPDDDALILIAPCHVPALIAALERELAD